MECPFVEVGCIATSILSIEDYQQHLSQKTEEHMQMVADFHQNSIMDMTRLKATLLSLLK